MKKTYIIAEAGVNHNGSKQLAFELIACAAEAGADAVKFQTFQADKIVSRHAPKAAYQLANTDADETQYAMLKRLELTHANHHDLNNYCQQRNIQFLSTPFDLESLHFLTTEINVPLIKIASGEITNGPLLLSAAYTKKPILLSTGMTTLSDIENALSILACGYLHDKEKQLKAEDFLQSYRSTQGQKLLQKNVVLLHCVSNYPAAMHEVNLAAIDTLRTAFQLSVGYSDHTQGNVIPIAAVARGASVIEKHFTLDRQLPGPDHKASLQPDELKAMVLGIRQTEFAIGNGQKLPSAQEMENRRLVRKSLVTVKKICRGETFNAENLSVKRPGLGICATRYWEWLGKLATKDYAENEWVTE